MNLLSKKQNSQPNDLFYTNNMLLSGSYVEEKMSINNISEFYRSYTKGETRSDEIREIYINVSDKVLISTIKIYCSSDLSCEEPLLDKKFYYDIISDVSYDSDSNLFKFKAKGKLTTLTPRCFQAVKHFNENNAHDRSDWILNVEKEAKLQENNMYYYVVSPIIGNRIFVAASEDSYPNHVDSLNEYVKQ